MMIKIGRELSAIVIWAGFLLICCNGFSSSNSIRSATRTLSSSIVAKSSPSDDSGNVNGLYEDPSVPVATAVKKVVVTGATGKTGRLVVEELIKRQIEVVGLVRNETKARELFASIVGNEKDGDDSPDTKFTWACCDLTDPVDIAKKVKGCDAAIWCATGFAENGNPTSLDGSSNEDDHKASSSSTNVFSKLLLAIKKFVENDINTDGNDEKPSPTPPPSPPSPENSIDIIGLPIISKIIMEQQEHQEAALNEKACPKVVMLSSAGVTRPSWDDNKKERLSGCADIPIVRLNPFGILDIKAESEKKLRETTATAFISSDDKNDEEITVGVDYCILRPCGLNDQWPRGARPVFTQGDVAVGRINRHDVAKILCDVLSVPEACRKTFEVIGLAGYPSQTNIEKALSRLKCDSSGISEHEVETMYNIAQQLLPGEKQDAAALAMGQTYEQLDKGETGRLGERGTEDAEAAAPKPTTVARASRKMKLPLK